VHTRSGRRGLVICLSSGGRPTASQFWTYTRASLAKESPRLRDPSVEILGFGRLRFPAQERRNTLSEGSAVLGHHQFLSLVMGELTPMAAFPQPDGFEGLRVVEEVFDLCDPPISDRADGGEVGA
jgi:hypothetical protein